MKITRKQLRRIIKEELSLLREYGQQSIIDPPRKLEYGETCAAGYELNILGYCELVASAPMAVDAEIYKIEGGR